MTKEIKTDPDKPILKTGQGPEKKTPPQQPTKTDGGVQHT